MDLKKILPVTAAVICIMFILSEEGWCAGTVIEWEEMYGAGEGDAGSFVQQTNDGGYIIVGTTESFGAGEKDLWLIKTDSQGREEWSRTFGGELSDMGKSVRQTEEGGYIVTGATRSYGAGKRDVWLIKTDMHGDEEWSRTFGGPEWDYGRSVEQTDDGGYIIAGYTDSFGAGYYDMLLVRTDPLGNPEWVKTFGGALYDYSYSVSQTSDGGYIVTGETSSFGSGNYDIWIVKTDSDGEMEWDSIFGGPGVDRGRCGVQTSDGGYIITGYTDSVGAGLEDAVLIKTDASGNMMWGRTYGGPDEELGRIVMQTPRGGYIFGGYTSSFGSGFDDMWMVGTDAAGREVWSWTHGGGYLMDRLTSAVQIPGREIVVLGQSRRVGTADYNTHILKLLITP